MKNLVITICAGIGMMFAITYCDASNSGGGDARPTPLTDVPAAGGVISDGGVDDATAVVQPTASSFDSTKNYCIDNTPAPVLSSSASTIPTVVIAASASAIPSSKPSIPTKSSSHK